MRNLTITRRKSFVGCAMKDRVYIRDDRASEITIEGVPCRKIGEIKNGETKTFQIEEGEQQIFLIADKLSKNYCNATMVIPEGQEDVTLSGVHKFVFGSNPFRFDGVEQSPEQAAKQKKNGRIGMVIMIAALILGSVLGRSAAELLFRADTASPKTYTKEDFSITLTDGFTSEEGTGFHAFYQSKTAMVFTLREEKALFGNNISLAEYVDFVLEANGRTGLEMNRENGLIWFEYTDTPEQQEIYYLVVCCQGEDAFWIVNFATPATNRAEYREMFLNWAKTIEVG